MGSTLTRIQTSAFKGQAKAFALYGRKFAKEEYWYLPVISFVLGLIVIAALLPGLKDYKTEGDIAQLYIREGTRLEGEKKYFESKFGGISRQESVITTSDSGNIGTKKGLRTILDFATPIWKQDETEKCHTYDGVVSARPAICDAYQNTSLYCSCPTVAASPDMIYITVENGEGVPVNLTEKDLCESPTVPKLFAPASAPSIHYSDSRATQTPVFQYIYATELNNLLVAHNLSSNVVFTNAAIKGQAEAACFAAYQSSDPANKNIVAAQLCGLAVASYLITSVGVPPTQAQGLAGVFSKAAGTAFGGQQFYFLNEGNYFSHSYQAVAQCVYDYQRSTTASSIANDLFANLISNFETNNGTTFYPAGVALAKSTTEGLIATHSDVTNPAIAAKIGGAYVVGSFSVANVSLAGFNDTHMNAVRAATINALTNGYDLTNSSVQVLLVTAYTDAGGNLADAQNAVFYVLSVLGTIKVNAAVATPTIIESVLKTHFGMSKLIPESVTANGTFRVLPETWGVDRFPCTRAVILDVFKEGDFDYPYAMKQLDQVSEYLFWWFYLPFPHDKADCVAQEVTEPVRDGVYLKMLLEPQDYTPANFPAFAAAEAAFLQAVGAGQPTASAVMAADVAYATNGGTTLLNTGNLTTLQFIMANSTYATALGTAVANAAGQSHLLTENIELIIQAVFLWGYHWREAYGDHWTATAELSEASVFELLNYAYYASDNQDITSEMCVIGNTDLQQGLGEEVESCFVAWSSTRLPKELAFGGLSFANASELALQAIGATNTAGFNFNEGDPLIKRRLDGKLGRQLTKEDISEFNLEFETKCITFLKKKWEKEVGSGHAAGEAFAGENVYMTFERSVDDVVRDASDLDARLLIGSIAMLYFVVILFFLNVTNSVYSHMFMTVAGVTILGLGILSGYGFGLYVGVTFTPISAAVVPFLALGFGIDDMLVVAQAFSRAVVRYQDPAAAVGFTLAEAGPAVLFTSMVNFVAFMIAGSYKIVVVRSFAYLMAIITFINSSLLFLIFVPIMVWAAKRVYNNKSEYGIMCCKRPQTEKSDHFGFFAKKYYGPFLMHPIVKVIVILGFFAFFGVMAWRGFGEGREGLRVSKIATKGSYQAEFATVLEDDFTIYPGTLVTHSDNFPAAQQNILDTLDELQGSTWLVKSLRLKDLYWLSDSLQSLLYTYNAHNASAPIPEHVFYEEFATWLSTTGAALSNDIVCKDSTTGLLVDCFDIVGAFSVPPLPGSNKNVVIDAVKGGYYLREQSEHDNFLAAIEDTRARVDNAVSRYDSSAHNDSSYDSFVIGYTYFYWESFLYISDDLLIIVGWCLLGVFVTTFLFQFNILTSFYLCIVIFMVVIELYGFMGYFGVELNPFSLVNLCLTTGMGVEFTAHVAYAFLAQEGDGTRNSRTILALESMFGAMMQGCLTSLLGLLFVLGSPVVFIKNYYFWMFFVMCLIALANGIVFLPVVLSLIGAKAMPIKDFVATVGHSRKPSKVPDDDQTLNNPLYDLRTEPDSTTKITLEEDRRPKSIRV